MPSPDPVSAFAGTLRALSVLFQRVASETSSAHVTFSKQELSTITVLGVRGPSPMGALAEHLGVGRSAITPLADRLETQGVIARRRSESDRRVWLAELTGDGWAVFQAERAAFERVAETMLSVLDADERRQFVAMMARIQAATASDSAA